MVVFGLNHNLLCQGEYGEPLVNGMIGPSNSPRYIVGALWAALGVRLIRRRTYKGMVVISPYIKYRVTLSPHPKYRVTFPPHPR